MKKNTDKNETLPELNNRDLLLVKGGTSKESNLSLFKPPTTALPEELGFVIEGTQGDNG